MQITIDTKELNQSQMSLLMQIINPFWNEHHGATVSNDEQPCEKVEELPCEKVDEKPKRTRRTKAEIEAENAQTPEETSEVVEQEIVASSTISLTLSDIKTKAQELVTKVSRDAVKNTINKYADKISEVKESDYLALMADFEALEG